MRYIVTETLDGRSSALKERRIGADVFQRDAAYETSADPIVRTTAVEVRKRLAQYYQDPGRDSEIRVILSAGHYAPDFHLPAPVVSTQQSAVAREARSGRRVFLWWTVGLLALGVMGVFLSVAFRRDPADPLWRPIWLSADPVMLVIGDAPNGFFSEAAHTAENSRDTRVGFADSVAEAEVAAMLQGHNKRYEFRLAGATTLGDLKRAPAVLVGALSNSWTMSLQDQLWFSIHWDDKRVWIRDRQKPDAALYWVGVDRDMQYSKNVVDYGVVARFTDPRTQQSVLILAGLGGGGTRAAAEFVTQTEYLRTLDAAAPRGWERKNLEVVLAVDMVNGIIGAPRIAAVHVW